MGCCKVVSIQIHEYPASRQQSFGVKRVLSFLETLDVSSSWSYRKIDMGLLLDVTIKVHEYLVSRQSSFGVPCRNHASECGGMSQFWWPLKFQMHWPLMPASQRQHSNKPKTR